MKPRSPSVGLRAVLALGLMIGFYALALGLAGALLWVPYAEVTYTNRIHPKLALGCLVGAAHHPLVRHAAAGSFRGARPRARAREAPEALRDDPRRRLRDEAGDPAEVYLVGDMNAWVAHRGGMMGVGARGIMGLGLPLLQTLSVSELRAVLAHEFGHYHGGDTKLGRFVYVTRAAIGRTLENLGRHGSILQLPFLWYGNLFLRVSHAVSRRQELAADQLAAHVVGARPLAEGLKKIHVAAPAFGYYWSNEVAPVLHAGFVPPLAAGFQRFVAGEIGQKAMAAAREHSLKEGEGDVFDTHPPLRERLKALEGCRPGDITGADPLAITLLADPQALERAVIAPVLPSADGQPLPPIQWSEVGERVYQPIWQKETDGAAAHCRPLTVEALGQQASRLSETLGAKLLPEWEVTATEVRQLRGNWALGSALAVALSQAGWATEAQPGEPVMLRGPAGTIDPFGAVQALVKGEIERGGVGGRSASGWGSPGSRCWARGPRRRGSERSRVAAACARRLPRRRRRSPTPRAGRGGAGGARSRWSSRR